MTITKTELKTYTLNATPERYDVTPEENEARHASYAKTISDTFIVLGIDGFTLTEVRGYWQGTPEKSYIITVATDAGAEKIEQAASVLREYYNQDAVMLTYPDGTVAFIEA